MSNNGELEQWQIRELVDDAIAVGKVRPEMINDYVYEFKIGNRVARDLTANAYADIAIRKNLSTVEVKKTAGETGVLYEVTVAKMDPDLPPEHWQRKHGVAFQPYEPNKLGDFSFQKALTKATRNAIKQFVSCTDIHEAINRLQGINAAPAPPSALQIQALELYKEHEEKLQQLQISSEMFWNVVKKRYGVDSRDEMTDENWKDIIDSLNHVEPNEDATPYAEWIHNIVPF